MADRDSNSAARNPALVVHRHAVQDIVAGGANPLGTGAEDLHCGARRTGDHELGAPAGRVAPLGEVHLEPGRRRPRRVGEERADGEWEKDAPQRSNGDSFRLVAVSAVAANVGDTAGRAMAVVLTAVLPVARAARPAVVSAAAIEPARRRKRYGNENARDSGRGSSKEISHRTPPGREGRE